MIVTPGRPFCVSRCRRGWEGHTPLRPRRQPPRTSTSDQRVPAGGGGGEPQLTTTGASPAAPSLGPGQAPRAGVGVHVVWACRLHAPPPARGCLGADRGATTRTAARADGWPERTATETMTQKHISFCPRRQGYSREDRGRQNRPLDHPAAARQCRGQPRHVGDPTRWELHADKVSQPIDWAVGTAVVLGGGGNGCAFCTCRGTATTVHHHPSPPNPRPLPVVVSRARAGRRAAEAARGAHRLPHALSSTPPRPRRGGARRASPWLPSATRVPKTVWRGPPLALAYPPCKKKMRWRAHQGGGRLVCRRR